MNRFLVLALTAGLLSPIAANAESYWLIIVRIGSGAGVEKVQMASMAQCEKELEKIAKTVAVGTIRYEMIKPDLDKIITFDLKNSLRLEGDTCSYIQYSYARASRILEKAQTKPNFDSGSEYIEITTSPEDFGKVSSGLEDAGYEIEGEVGLAPINFVNVAGNDVKQLLQLIEKLEEHEDIQKVYSNFDVDESELNF